MKISSIVIELLNSSQLIGTEISLVEKEIAREFIKKALNKFNPQNTTNHLSVGENCLNLPIDEYEYTYSDYLKSEPGFLFFEQSDDGPETLLKINNIRNVGNLFYNSFGIEYFLTNYTLDFLISVNWYTIKITPHNLLVTP